MTGLLIVLSIMLLGICFWVGLCIIRRNPTEVAHLPVMSAVYGNSLLFVSALGDWLAVAQDKNLVTFAHLLAIIGIFVTLLSVVYLQVRRYHLLNGLLVGWGMWLMVYSLNALMANARLQTSWVIFDVAMEIVGAIMMVVAFCLLLRAAVQSL